MGQYMAWNVDNHERFKENTSPCKECTHRDKCSDLNLLRIAIDNIDELWEHKGTLAVIDCSGYKNEADVWR